MVSTVCAEARIAAADENNETSVRRRQKRRRCMGAVSLSNRIAAEG
jgi:hypothetical protein